MYVFLIVLFIIAVLYLFAIWPCLSRQDRMKRYDHTLFAHRGYHNKEYNIPENSMSAFRAAVEKGYGIELDLHLTRDGRLAVFHDDDLYRVCGSHERIEDLTYQELGRFHLFQTKEHIPLFTDVLTYVNGQVPLLIELKIPDRSLRICEAVCEALKRYKGGYLVQSFNTMGIHWFKLHAPDMLRGQLSSDLTKKKSGEPWLFRFMVKNLLINFLGRPDFISYKMADLPIVSVSILKGVLRTPVAVWTLRTEKALEQGMEEYNMQIFEMQK